MRYQNRYPGNTLTEYSIALGLVAILGIFGLQVLGPGIRGNLTEASQTKGTLSVLGPIQGGGSGGGSASAAPTGSGGSQGGGNAASNPANASSLADTASPATIQVSGSNGDSGKVYGNSQKLFQIAQKYKETDPDTYNLIMKLGQQGQTVGTSMMSMASTQFGQSNAIDQYSGGSKVEQASEAAENASKNFNSQSNSYRDLWGFEVKTSPQYAALSAADQQTIYNLAEESVAAMQNYQPTESDAQNLGSAVHDKGVKTEQCGAKGHC